MSRSYPIWNEIESCIYNGGKSYGVKEAGCVRVHVGTSKTNSHILVNHCVTARKQGDYTVFKFSVEGVIIKTGWMHKKPGSDLLFTEPAELKKAAA